MTEAAKTCKNTAAAVIYTGQAVCLVLRHTVNVHTHACTQTHEQASVVHFKAAISKTLKRDTFFKSKYYKTPEFDVQFLPKMEGKALDS